ncbi:MAG TPA: biopolymer transporter ExbD [Burkholderiaceae bacterium]|nr:biopolymer transporter ExbD [Burkholderiaceae bacterium]
MSMNIGASEVHHGDPELMMEMNTTPLIDVMLVLLVMLIITIPLNMHAVNVELPKSANEPPPEMPTIINIKVNAKRQILWNDEAVTKLAYEKKLEQEANKTKQPEIHFLPEPGAKYEDVIGAMAAAQRLNLKQIGIPTIDTFAGTKAAGQ